MTHLFVTNDYPPKIGGIQSYLHELWRRLPPGGVTVITRAYRDDASFDAIAGHRVIRLSKRVLLPTHGLAKAIRNEIHNTGATLVVLDPVFPLGAIARKLDVPYALVLHGAEVTVPARLPLVRHAMARTIREARLVIAAGTYPAMEARRLVGAAMPETVIIPPGVDAQSFRPLDPIERAEARRHFGVDDDALVVVSVSRLVPRKGMDVLIEAASRLSATRPSLQVLIAGTGRDRKRLSTLIGRPKAPVRLLGRLADGELARLYGAADLFVMLARNRWLGLEQEGFGIVYLEAAACGVAQVAGRSGGTPDAVEDRVTGIVVDRGGDIVTSTAAIGRLLDDEEERGSYASAGRTRVLRDFDYDKLAEKLALALERAEG